MARSISNPNFSVIFWVFCSRDWQHEEGSLRELERGRQKVLRRVPCVSDLFQDEKRALCGFSWRPKLRRRLDALCRTSMTSMTTPPQHVTNKKFPLACDEQNNKGTKEQAAGTRPHPVVLVSQSQLHTSMYVLLHTGITG